MTTQGNRASVKHTPVPTWGLPKPVQSVPTLTGRYAPASNVFYFENNAARNAKTVIGTYIRM